MTSNFYTHYVPFVITQTIGGDASELNPLDLTVDEPFALVGVVLDSAQYSPTQDSIATALPARDFHPRFSVVPGGLAGLPYHPALAQAGNILRLSPFHLQPFGFVIATYSTTPPGVTFTKHITGIADVGGGGIYPGQ
jgi:hypothetical protein